MDGITGTIFARDREKNISREILREISRGNFHEVGPDIFVAGDLQYSSSVLIRVGSLVARSVGRSRRRSPVADLVYLVPGFCPLTHSAVAMVLPSSFATTAARFASYLQADTK